MGSPSAEVGDMVCVFNGATAPCVLRKSTKHESVQRDDSITAAREVDNWEIIGDCYLHGFMNNEATSPEWQEKKEVIWIV
jgi:hypothetical protein